MSADPVQRTPVLTKSDAKGVETLPEHMKRACMKVVRKVAAGTARGKKLKGDLDELRSVRLGSSHRLIYRETSDQIQIVDVAPRGDIYKR